MYTMQAYKASWDSWVSISDFEDLNLLACIDFCDRNSCHVRMVEKEGQSEVYWLGHGVFDSTPRAGVAYQLEVYMPGMDFQWINFGHFENLGHAIGGGDKILRRIPTAFRVLKEGRQVALFDQHYMRAEALKKTNWMEEGF